MLDENLPTFFFKASTDTPLSTPIFLRQMASDLQPEYSSADLDPNLAASKNATPVALYDSCNRTSSMPNQNGRIPLSQAEVRAQNGIPPPPVPIVPNAFTIQLYNPDQQVWVKQIAGSWNSSAYWEFEMPQISFRAPSASALDRSQSDPAFSVLTPKVAFKWKKDGKFSKDLSCFLSGKTAEGKRNKEPDIPVAMFKGGKDLTIYQPNMHRVDVEDFKGLEVVLLLSAAVIKDIFFNASREMFNISSPNESLGALRKRNNSGPVIRENGRPSISPVMSGGISPWEIDAETARLKALVEAEERERQRVELLEEKRIKKMLEQEEKEQRRRDAEIAKETERLRKQYGVMPVNGNGNANANANVHPGARVQFAPQQAPQRPTITTPYSAPYSAPMPARPMSTGPGPAGYAMGMGSGFAGAGGPSSSSQARPQAQINSPYLQAPGRGTASSSGFFGGKKMTKVQKKRSVFF
ncbi:uncharacterized protein EAF02_006293 [Botrytis sinoallii]|uniref:uncharacterized protein n=1 Tax=Botrytis sinoallii TaxID=1463999 RepID=UPI00190283A8|nr:uncharacterized protein EAF02_006293 [Botrytis sinoallii]KAF7881605.1 hypothetical protein EAF02_006293 [Botrytis sinoallii]